MTEPATPRPETAQEPSRAHATPNGAIPLSDLARDLHVAKGALEDVNMRLQAIQVACALIVGLALLTLALEVKEWRAS